MTVINDNGIERQMTAKEQKEYDAWAQLAQKEQQNQQAKLDIEIAAKQSARAKLKTLGLTDDEIAALVG